MNANEEYLNDTLSAAGESAAGASNEAGADGFVVGENAYMLTEHWGHEYATGYDAGYYFTDAEKHSGTGTDDYLLCWAAVASNILQWGGWADGINNGAFDKEQDILDYYASHWTDQIGRTEYAWKWWLNGQEPSQYASVDVAGGNFYPSINVDSVLDGTFSNNLCWDSIVEHLEAGYGVGLSIFFYNDLGQRTSGHMLSAWGYEETDGEKYVYYTDSDDSMYENGGAEAAPDILRKSRLSWSGDYYVLDDYASSRLLDVQALKQFDSDMITPGSETFDSAKTISLENDSRRGNIDLVGDKDYYLVDLDTATSLNVTVSGLTSAELDFSIYNSDRELIKEVLNSETSYEFMADAGEYFIMVEGNSFQTDGDVRNNTYVLSFSEDSSLFDVPLDENSGSNDTPDNDDNDSDSGSGNINNENSFSSTKLIASDAASGDSFGESVAVSGNVVVVRGGGAGYIYQYNGDVWTETIVNDSGSVSTDGENVIVGHGLYQWSGTNWVKTKHFSMTSVFEQMAVDGDRVASSSSSGVLLYEFNGSTWDQTVLHALDPYDYEAWNHTGQTVSVDGDIVVSGLNGDDTNGTNSGCAYIFQYNGTNWDETKIISSDNMAGDEFGYSAAVDGDTVVVGAKNDNNSVGSAYVYKWNGSEWLETKLTASDGDNGDEFGRSVSITGNTILVGANNDSTDTGTRTGSTYMYQWNGNEWQETKITASDGATGDAFGYVVAVDGEQAVIGAYGDDDMGTNSGSAYVYNLSEFALVDPPVEPPVDTIAPSTPNGLLGPVDGSSVALDWANSADASGIKEYVIQYADNAQFTAAVQQAVTYSELNISGLDDDIYYWRVKAVDNNDNESAWSTTDSFVVDTVVDPPVDPPVDHPVVLADSSIKITASDGAAGERFGDTLSISGNNLVVGTQISGDENNGLGKAYVYRWNGTTYDETILRAADGTTADYFGGAVAMSGDNVIIGAIKDDEQTYNAGSAYIYTWNGSSYEEITKVTASDGKNHDEFGISVDISGYNAVVGTERGDGSDGLAYAYRWDGSGYTEYKLLASDRDYTNNEYGESVSISGDNIVVSAHYDTDNGSQSGSAYVFRWNGTGYDEIKLTASDGAVGDKFSEMVSIDGDNVAVGAHGNDSVGNDSGSAYVYRWDGSGYDEYKLTASDISAGDYFGHSVSISGDFVLVGTNRSSAYLYHWNGSSYNEVKKLTSSDNSYSFGRFVSIDGGDILVAAYNDSDNGSDAGAAYVYNLAADYLATPFGLVDTVNYSDVALDWVDSVTDVGIKGYVIEYADNSGFDDAIIQTVGTSELDLSNMADGTYYWRVKSVNNDDGESPWSVTDSFVVEFNAASVPDGLSDPVSGSDVALDWNDSESMIGIKEYIVQYDDDQNFNSAETQTVVDSELTLNNMANGTYYWRVKAVNNDDEQSAWSEADKFYLTSATTETTKLLASNYPTWADFGKSVVIDGDMIVVGGGSNAYIYQLNEDTWNETIIDNGGAVATDGDNIIIGRDIYQWDGSEWNNTNHNFRMSGFDVMDIDGDNAVSAGYSGAYLYQRDDTGWTETLLFEKDESARGFLGQAIAIDGDIIVAGLNGDDTKGVNSGSANIYQLNGATWEKTIITASDATAGDNFGYSVAVDDNIVVVGADKANNSTGAVYVYQWNGSTWAETKLTASDGANWADFGRSVAIDGDTILVGASGDSNDVARIAGSAYVYNWNGSIWAETKLIASDGEWNDRFGESVSIDGNVAVIGAHNVDDNGKDAGAAYIYDISELTQIDHTVDTIDPSTPNGLSDLVDGLRVALDWDDSADASGIKEYVLQYADNAQFTAAVQQTVTASELNVGELNDDTYYWRVKAVDNNDNESAWSTTDSFFVGTEDQLVSGSSTKLIASDAASGDSFGESVAVSGNVVVVRGGGAGYIYQYNGDVWTETIVNDSGSVSTDGENVIVGHGLYQWSGTNWVKTKHFSMTSVFEQMAVDGDRVASSSSSGVLLYEFNGSTWDQTVLHALDPYDYEAWNHTGQTVSVDGDIVVSGLNGDDTNGTNSGCAYIFQYNGTTWDETKIISSDNMAGDEFGYSAAVDGNIVVVGAKNDNNKVGSAYVYKWNGSEWLETKLTASDGDNGDEFGRSVSISGNTILVGANNDSTDTGTRTGSTYMYQWNGNEWQETKITASDGATGDAFGYVVAVDGEQAVIGAYGDDDMGTNSGSAYVYNLSEFALVDPPVDPPVEPPVEPPVDPPVDPSVNVHSNGSVQFTASNGSTYSSSAVSMSGDNIVIGVSGDDEQNYNAGSAYVYKWNGSSFEEITKLTASDGGSSDEFGMSVDISGVNVVVGTERGDGNDGLAYAYRWDGSEYTEYKLLASDRDYTNNEYAKSVSISGDNIVVSAHHDADNGSESGSAYIFRWNGTGYDEIKLTASDGANGDKFSEMVSIDGYNVAVGAHRNDSMANDSGSVYVYRWDGSEYDEYKLTASDASAYDCFGRSVSISGDYVLVGNDRSNAYLYHWNGSSYTEVNKLSSQNGSWFGSPNWFGHFVSIDGDNILMGDEYDDVNGYSDGAAHVFNLSELIPVGPPVDPPDSLTGGLKITASDGAAGEHFSDTLSISGNNLIVGSQIWGDSNNGLGRAYIYRWNGIDYDEIILRASDGTAADYFGGAVAISGDNVIIGAIKDDEQNYNAGSAYIYTWNGSSYEEITKVTASDGKVHDEFGISVDISGYNAVVGTERGDGSDGLAYAYRWDGSEYTEYKLLASDRDYSNNEYGESVSISGDNIVVSAHHDADNGSESGSAYIFRWNGTGYDEIKLTASDGANGDKFSEIVSIDGDNVAVGAHRNDSKGNDTGSVYVYRWDGSEYDEYKLTASDASGYDCFGRSVSISGDYVLVGTDDASAYLYQWNGSSYNEVKKLTPQDNSSSFGKFVSIDGDNILVGALDDNDNGSGAGAAYVFNLSELTEPPVEPPVDTIAPSTPTALSDPVDGSRVALDWNDSTDASGIKEYVIQHADNAQFSAAVQQRVTASELSIGALNDDIYYWRVKAVDNNDNESAWSATDSFVVDDLVEPPVVLPNGSMKLIASDGANMDFFGYSVSISGGAVIVGAPQDNDDGPDSGSVYIYRWNGEDYDEHKLTASDGEHVDYFGKSVSISGDTIVAGAYGDDENGPNSGSAYVYRWNGSDYVEYKLTASDGEKADWYGLVTSVSDDVVVIGAHRDNDNGSHSGSAYVYRWNGTSYDETKLIASDGVSTDYFGASVFNSADTVVVGAVGDDDNGENSGSAYVYRWDGSSYTEHKLIASDGETGEEFGTSVSFSENNVVVGALSDDVNGSHSGSAYVYRWNGTSYDEYKLTASDGADNDYFGNSVSISGDYVLVGAYKDDDDGNDSGSAYLYEWNGSSYDEINKLTAYDAEAGDFFGCSVSISGDTVVVGANLDDDNGQNSGSAYVYSLAELIPDLTAPSTPNGLTDSVNGSSIAFDWDDSTDASGIKEYIVEYANDEAFTNATQQTVTASKLDIGGLDDDTYYWRVKAVDNNDNTSAWSSTDSVVVAPVSDDLLPTPYGLTATGSSDRETYIFNWSVFSDDLPETTKYYRQMAYVDTFVGGWSSLGPTTENKLVGFNDRVHYWRVRTVDANGNESAWSITDSFKVDTTPFGLVDQVTGSGVSFDWDDSTDASGIKEYVLEYADNYHFNDSATHTVVNSDLLLADMTDSIYYWRVKAINNNDIKSAWSQTDSFIVGTAVTAPSMPTKLIDSVAGLTVTLDWDDSLDDSGIKEYIVEHHGHDNAVTLKTSTSSELSLNGMDLGEGGRSWRVKAVDNNGNESAWSRSEYFYVPHPPVDSIETVAVYGGITFTVSDAMAAAKFGESVAVYGDTVVISAHFDGDNGAASGAAYVYRWNGASYDESKLIASDGAAYDKFGEMVSIFGDNIAIGAHRDDTNANDSGSVYVYHWDGSEYGEYKLTASDASSGACFGRSVSISGDYVLVGTDRSSAYLYHWNGSSYEEVNKLIGPDNDRSFGRFVSIDGDSITVGSGAKYVYSLAELSESYVIPVTPVDSIETVAVYGGITFTVSDAMKAANFGESVAVSGDTVVISAHHDADNGSQSGAAYVYRWNGASYDETKLIASDGAAGDKFGEMVAIDGDNIAVGAHRDDTNANDSGSVYVYHWDGSGYGEYTLTASDASSRDCFGRSVSISGDYVLVGTDHGSAYLYHWNGSSYEEVNKLIGPDNDRSFGRFVSIDGDSITVGSGAKYVYSLAELSESYIIPVDPPVDPPVDSPVDPPVVPVSNTPSTPDGLTDPVYDSRVAISWNNSTSSSGISRYFIEYSNDSDFGASSKQFYAVTRDYSLNNLANGTYYWHVKAIDNNNNESEWSSTDSFVVDAVVDFIAPSTPTALSDPVNGTNVALDWTDSVDDSSVKEYIVEYANDEAFTNATQQTVTASKLDIGGLDDDTYYWRVKAVDTSDNESAWSTTDSFVIDAEYQFDSIKLTASDATRSVYFGKSVSIFGDNIAVGAQKDAYDVNRYRFGSAYVYQWNGSSYDELKLIASDGAEGDKFGCSVSVFGDNVAVGAVGDDDRGSYSGSAYVYRWNGAAYDEYKLTASNGAESDLFGNSVSMSGDNVAVGASRNNDDAGSAYVYRWNGSSYDETKLTASDTVSNDRFGSFVCMSGDNVVVGACDDDRYGSVYSFRWNGTSYDEYKLTAPDLGNGNDFGKVVSVFDDNIVVGTRSTDDSAYVYRWNGSGYDEYKLTASDGVNTDSFGCSVSIYKDYVFAGARCRNDDGTFWGNVYVYRWNGSSYDEINKVISPEADSSFGESISIDGDRIVIGKWKDDEKADNSGAAYVYSLAGLNFLGTPYGLVDPVSGSDVALDWNDSIADFGVKGYLVEYADNNTFTNAVTQNLVASELALNDIADGTYYWRVKSVDNNNNESEWSMINDFVVDVTPPTTPDALLSGNLSGLTLEWNDSTDVSGIREYIVQYADNNEFINASSRSLSFNECELFDIDNGTTYYWRVKAVDNNGNESAWSTVDSFSVDVEYQFVMPDGSIKLIASNATSGDCFGREVSISGDNILIGMSGDDINEISTGSAYVYRWNGSSYDELKLMASDGAEDDEFACSVSISGDNVVVGASDDDDKGSCSGSAYVYRWNGEDYDEYKLTASDGASCDIFGTSVSISGENVVVGASDDDDKGYDSGSAYVYRWNGTSYDEYKLMASDGEEDDNFGHFVAIDGDTVVVGASAEKRAYVYRWNGTSYDETKLSISNVAVPDYFWYKVSISGNNIVVGDSEGSNNGISCGNAYVYRWNGEDYDEYKLTASDAAANASFGSAVAISDDYVVVANRIDRNGVAYIFRWNGSDYDEINKITSFDIAEHDNFASSVSISGDKLLIGDCGDDDKGNDAGAAYVYSLSELTPEDQLAPSIPDGLMDLVSESNVALDWNDSTDASGIKEYIFQYSDSIDFSIVDSQTVVASEINLNFLENGTYYWRVKAMDNIGCKSDWSVTDSFVIDAEFPVVVPEGISLTASDGAALEYFGYSICVSGDNIAVGAARDDDNGESSGSAYVYRWNGEAYDEYKLTASNGTDNASFGNAISISGDYVLVGAYEDNAMGMWAGRAYLYHWNGSAYDEINKLSASDYSTMDNFGKSVSISGDNMIVGAFGASSAYIYRKNGSDYDEYKLTASDAEQGDSFGTDVSMYGDSAVVGAMGKNAHTGSAYVYRWNGSAYDEHKLTASDGAETDRFGKSVSMYGDNVAVGAYLDDDNDKMSSGSAYVYRWNGEDYDEYKVTASDAAVYGYFGCSVSMSGDYLLVGAQGHTSFSDVAGDAYLYHWNGSSYDEVTKIRPVENDISYQFGFSVSICDDTIAVGALFGNNTNGSAHVYSLDELTSWATPVASENLSAERVQRTDVKLDWTNPMAASKYQIQVDDNADFSSIEFDAESIDSEITFTDLNSGRYYWRVRAFAGGRYGDWTQNDSYDSENDILPLAGGSFNSSGDIPDWRVNASGEGEYGSWVEGDYFTIKNSPVNDLDGNGKSDILWRRERDGRLYAWNDGDLSNGWRAMGSSPFTLVGMGDFDGSSTTDVLWRRESDGNLYAWNDGDLSNGWKRMGASPFKFVGIGDFDGNGTSDILWQRESDDRFYAWDDGDLSNGWRAMGSSPFTLLGIGDFDGNGTSDLLWERESDGKLYVWDDGNLSNGWNYIGTSPFTLRGIGDFDGNGTSDLLWERESDGSLYAWDDADLSNGWRRLGSSPFTMLDIGDYDGNGTSDILWQRESDGNLYSWSDGELANGWTKQGTCPDNFTLLSNIA